MKCKVCNGTGFVGIGPGIRGIKKCDVCNGEGEVNAPEHTPNDACPTCGTLFPTDDRADYIPVEEIHFLLLLRCEGKMTTLATRR